ncbi:MAG: GreA/GreB family elongation factor [Parcubacteria group bacterium]|nr:GreA/GreB family elongation factor [Parcubacteria group bacterium]
MTKQKLLQNVIEKLRQEIKSAEQSFTATKNAAIEAPGAMQSHSDTTKFQMSQLAEEIQRSIYEKSLALSTLQNMIHQNFSPDSEKVEIGSLIETLNEDGKREFYFILPVGSGIKIVDNDKTISVITPQAPLAVALIGKREKEVIKLQIGHRQRELMIAHIQ